MATEIQSDHPSPEAQQQVSKAPSSEVEANSEPIRLEDNAVSPTFEDLWAVNDPESWELVEAYRRAGMPPTEVFSRLLGDVHVRRDVHPIALCKTEAGCGNWNPDKRHARPKVVRKLRVQSTADLRPIETSGDESRPHPEETASQSE
jgi:hypothetical protein